MQQIPEIVTKIKCFLCFAFISVNNPGLIFRSFTDAVKNLKDLQLHNLFNNYVVLFLMDRGICSSV